MRNEIDDDSILEFAQTVTVKLYEFADAITTLTARVQELEMKLEEKENRDAARRRTN